MTLNPQTQSLVLSPHHHSSNPCFAPFLPSLLHIHKLSICIFLLVVFFFFFLFHVFCLFRFPVASAAIHRRSSSFHMSLSPFIALHFYCRVSVSNFHPFTLSFFSLLFSSSFNPPFLLSAPAVEVVSVCQPVSGGSSRKWAE